MTRRIWLGTVAACAVLAPLGAAQAISIRDDAAPDGIAAYYDSGNAYPNVGAIRIGTESYCTGTLLNARTMLTASHCFYSNGRDVADNLGRITNVSFSPEAGTAATAQATSVRLNAAFAGEIPTGDIALIAFDRPVTSLTPVTVATSAQATGQAVILVGYGLSALGSDPDGAISDSRRRVSYNILDFVGAATGLPPTQDGSSQDSSQVVVAIDFDAPGYPSTNSLGAALAVTGEGSVLPGDSGGPMFVTLADGQLLQIGVLSGGYPPQGVDFEAAELPDGTTVVTYGDVDFWPAVWTFQDWLSSNSFLQSASAVAGDGSWSTASHWSGGVVPNNSSGFVAGGAARYYDVSLDQTGTTSLDMNAAIDTLTVNNDGAALALASPWTLTTEVGATLAAGQVDVAGSLVAPWLRVTGGTLSGSGSVTAAVTQTGGTISPGGSGSIGTLTVAGPFQQSGGLLLAELSADASDRLSATGAVALAGGLQVALLGTAPPPDGAVFVLASGSSMEAATLPAPDAIGAVSFSLAAVDGDLRLLVGRRALTGLAGDDAGRAVAGALDSMRGQPGYAALFDSLDVLPSFQMAQALDQLGAVPTTAGAVSRAVSSSFLGAASDRLAAVRSGAGPTAGNNAAALRLLLTPEPEAAALLAAEDAPAGAQVARPRLSGPSDGLGSSRTTGPVLALGATGTSGAAAQAMPWGAWVQPFGLRAERRGDGAGNRWDSTIGGVTGGIDYRLRGDGAAEGLLLGASLGYARGDTGYRERGGETRLRTWQAGLYGGWWRGPWSLDAGIGAAVNSYRSRRDLNFGTTRATAEGDYRGRQLSGHLDARHQQRFAVGGPGMLEVGPMAGLQALRLETDSYDETGAGAMNLSVAADTVTSLRSSLGGAVAYPMTLPDGTWLRPELRLRWAHEFADTATVVDAAFAGPGGAAFEVRSDDLDRDSALLGAGLEARLKGGLSLSGAYDLQLQQGYSVQALTARMRLAF